LKSNLRNPYHNCSKVTAFIRYKDFANVIGAAERKLANKPRIIFEVFKIITQLLVFSKYGV
jgi:hypothetical protein